MLVGEVSAVTTNGTGADVHLQLDPGKVAALPANVTAQLLPKTLFGERYVDLDLPGPAVAAEAALGRHHRAGHARRSRSSSSSCSPTCCRCCRPSSRRSSPRRSPRSRRRCADAVPTWPRRWTIVGRYLAKLAPQAPQIGSDLGALAQVARTYTQAAPDLVSALDSMSTTSQHDRVASRAADPVTRIGDAGVELRRRVRQPEPAGDHRPVARQPAQPFRCWPTTRPSSPA